MYRCIDGQHSLECPELDEITVSGTSPQDVTPTAAPIHIDWPGLSTPNITGGGGSVTSSQRGNQPVQAATPPQVGLQGLSDQQTSTPNSPNQDSSVPNNPCGCGDKGQQAIDEWDNYLDNLANGELQQALNRFLRYYRDIGQPLNPNDYGKGIGP